MRILHNINRDIKHWWQRNFGHVFLTETRWKGELKCYRFKAWFGRINFSWWVDDFICRLDKNGGDLIVQNKSVEYSGKPYNGWKWSYIPTTDEVQEGGAW